MERRPIVPLLALSFAWGLAMPALAQGDSDGSVAQGLAYAQRTCSGCHAVLERDNGSTVRPAASFKAIANTPGMTRLALSVWFRSPHPNMPHIKLSDQEISDVSAYILSLKDKR